ncbi:hypothetical protein SLS58_005925 [Diplodia intermedia]|uniref:Myb-like domain-containing protein n=1 Tax=Diplodia intermedia TaxID=856260 RepID=A0ABR3TPK0_9PEZI
MSAFHGSSAINKSGKKFAPKVARRRPAAVSGSEAASATSSADQTPVGTPSASETPANEPVQSDPQNVLPTPPSTQTPSQTQSTPAFVPEQPAPPTAQPVSTVSAPVTHNDELETGGRSPKRRKVELSTSASEVSARAGQSAPSTLSDTIATPVTIAQPSGQPTEGDVHRTSVELSQVTANNTQELPSQASVAEPAHQAEEHNSAVGPAPQDSSESTSAGNVPKASKATQPKAVKRRGAARLSNRDLIKDVMGKNSGVTKPSRLASTTEEGQGHEQDRPNAGLDNERHEQHAPQADNNTQSLEDESAPNRAPKRAPNVAVARRRKQQVDAPAGDEQPSTEQQAEPEVAPAASGSAQAPAAKKPRQPRPKKRVAAESQNVGDGSNGDAEAPKSKRAKRKPKTPARVTEVDGEAEGTEAGITGGPAEEQGAATRKRPKSVLDHLVFDQEDHENPEKTKIDANSMPMAVLTRDISLVGTISQREEALSKVDWDEEKRKRMEERERIALGEEQAQTQAERDEALARLQEAANTGGASVQAPQMRVVNGVVMLDHASTTVDRNARAREDAEELQEVEEDELTTRVNQMSWIKANRKDPRERTSWGPTRADRWSDEQTNVFYDALKMFGTDFFIISKMFPGKTRANVKRKFVKEERLDPDRIKRVLIGESVPMDFEEYKRKTGKDDNFFRDPEQLRQELAQETEQQRQEVEEAQAKYAEQQRQRKLAKQGGADVDGEEGEAPKKGKKKKGEGKRGKKSKAPIGGEEVEVVEFEGDELEYRR